MSEIEIDRPPAVVWAYFTEADNWENWSRLELHTARWEVGGSLHFEKGMTSQIEAITLGSMVKYGDSWSEEIWTFELTPSGGTLVKVDETPKGMTYSDHGAAALAKTRKALEKFKAAVESDEPDDEAEASPYAPEATPAQPEIPAFAPDDPGDDDFGEGPNPRLRRIPF